MRCTLHRAALAAMVLAVFTAPAAFGQANRTASQPAQHAASVLRLTQPYAANAVSLLDEKQHYTFNLGWQLESRSVFTYDGIFRIEELAYDWNGAAWTNAARKRYTGNDFNRVTETELWDPAANDFMPLTKTDYEYMYDWQTGEPVVWKETSRYWDGGAWIDDERTVYTIGDGLTVTGAQMDRWDGSAWEPVDRYTLAEVDGQVHQTVQLWDGGAWTNAERVTFYYSTIKQLFAAVLAAEKTMGNYEELFFGLHLLPSSLGEEWDGSAWVAASRQGTYYDLFTGAPLFVAYEEWAGDRWIITSRLAFTFDESAALTALSYEVSEGDDEWHTLVREDYTLDDRGSITSAWEHIDLGGGLTAATRTDYFWRHTGTSAEAEELPAAFELNPAYPNPFNPSTRIEYALRESGHVAVRVYDGLGREVATLVDGQRAAGSHQVTFEAADLPSGLYLVRLETPHGRAVRAVTLLK